MASTKLSRTAGTPTSNKTFTISYWVKRSNIGSAGNGHIFDTFVDSSNRSQIHFDDDNVIDFRLAVSGTNIGRLKTNRVFRDTSAWYHIVASVDTTLGTADDRVKLYINGVQETSFSTRVNPSINADFPMGGTHTLGAYGGGSNYFDGTLSHFHFTDGYAYTPSTFGESDSTSGIWKPKTAPSVTYGTNGFFLKFENSANMDLDSSPNNHTFTTGGTITQTQDTPSNNFATLNPLHKGDTLTGFTFANGNNTITFGSTTYPYTFSTQAVSSGKWYAEFKVTANPNDVSIGISNGEKSPYLSHSQYDYAYVGSNGNVQSNQSGSSYGSALSTNDILGVAMDLDNNTIQFYVNGSSSGSAVSLLADETYFFAFSGRNSAKVECNFGSPSYAISSGNSDGNGYGNFEYSVPSGYYALNTKNLAEYG